MRLRLGLLAFLLAMAAQASPGLRLEGGPFLPYRINQGTALRAEGLFGLLELLGQRWDGVKVPLFRTRVTARSQSVALLFYLDEDIRGLELRMGGEGSVFLELAAEEGRGGPLDMREMELRKRMRGLDPPIHLARDGEPPGRHVFGGSDLVMSGFQASSTLFRISPSRTPLVPLAGFVFVALIAAAIAPSTRARLRFARILTLGGVLGATVAIVYLAAPRPVFFSVTFPADGPDMRMSGVVEVRTEERPSYRRVIYAAGQGEGVRFGSPGTVELVGLWAPVERGIPVAEVVPIGALVRFSAPPLAILREGELLFAAKDFLTGWVVHANG